jgi:50S ribosomal subunit-associated GTPase HflX
MLLLPIFGAQHKKMNEKIQKIKKNVENIYQREENTRTPRKSVKTSWGGSNIQEILDV